IVLIHSFPTRRSSDLIPSQRLIKNSFIGSQYFIIKATAATMTVTHKPTLPLKIANTGRNAKNTIFIPFHTFITVPTEVTINPSRSEEHTSELQSRFDL